MGALVEAGAADVPGFPEEDGLIYLPAKSGPTPWS